MARPTFTPVTIDPKTRGWDALVNDAMAQLIALHNTLPFAPLLVHKTTPADGSLALSGFVASDYPRCYLELVDAASPSTNGYLIRSDASIWRYAKSNTAV